MEVAQNSAVINVSADMGYGVEGCGGVGGVVYC